MALSSDSISLLFRAKGETGDAQKAFRDLKNSIGSDIDAIENKSKAAAGNIFASVLKANVVEDVMRRVTRVTLDAANTVFQFSSKLEQSKIGFATLMGGADNAKKHVEDLLKLARSTPLQFDSIAQMSQRLQGAGVEAQKIVPLITDIGNVAAATGELTGERMEGIATAFAQITSKGKVSAEEMEQLAERGVPAWRILSEAIGKTVAETRKMAENGKISSTELLEAFQRFSQVKFGDAMKQQSGTFSGAMSEISNIAIQAASTTFKPIYEEVSRFSSRIARSLKEQEAGARAAGVSFGFAIGEAIGEGVQKSEISKDSWWLTLLFPWAAITKFAQQVGKDIGEGLYKGYTNSTPQGAPLPSEIPGRAPFNAQTLSHLNPMSRPGALSSVQTDEEKKAAEKAAQERREIRKRLLERELDALKENLKLQIRAQAEATDRIDSMWEDSFLNKKTTEQEWREISESNFKIYADKVKELLKSAYALDSQGKTPLELENLRLAQVDAIGAVDKQIVRMREDREKTITGVIEKEIDQREKDDKAWWAYLKESLDQEGDEYIAKTKAFVDKVVKDAAFLASLPSVPLPVPTMSTEGGGPESPLNSFDKFIGTFAAGIAKYLEGVALIRNANGELEFSMKQVFTSVAEIGINAFGQLAAGFGQMVSNWVLYGNAGEQGLRKMTASILANVAQTAATYALMCLAAAALATTVWGAALLGGTPAQFLQGAALFGAVAAGAAVAGRATAGDSFKKASSGNFGTASSSGNRSGNGGSVYSSQEDGVVETSRNNPGGRGVLSQLRSEITLKIESTSAHIVEVVKSNINNNGQLRTAIQDATG